MTTRIEAQHPDHAEGLFAALSDPRIYAFLDDTPPASVAALRARIERLRLGPPDGLARWLNWTVFHDGAPVGYTQATILADGNVSIAYVLTPAVWGKGVGFAAARQTLRVLMRDAAPRGFLADTEVANKRSGRLLTRLGFRRLHETATEAFFAASPAEVAAALDRPDQG